MDNVKMIEETLSAIEKGGYLKEGWFCPLKLTDDQIRTSRVYLPEEVHQLKPLKSDNKSSGPGLQMLCKNVDSFSAARELAAISNERVLVLNLANPVNPGGGVRRGARAQEEDLCRKSTLLVSLEDSTAKEYYQYNKSRRTFMGSDAVMITPNVEILRDENGNWLNDSVIIAVMTCAAPMITYGLEGLSQTEYEAMVYRRIQGMLKTAASEGYRKLVLGAFGCGAFGNDAHLVSDLFCKAIRETDFNGKRAEDQFDVIAFAVLDKTEGQYNFNEFNRNFAENPTKRRND